MEETKLWINGVWEQTKETSDLKSPYTGKVIAKVAKATIDDVERAIEGANTRSFHFLQFFAMHYTQSRFRLRVP